jgi:torulene dioxygenase
VELRVEGTIPIYASGTLFRTGLGQRDVKTDKGNTYKVNHWFDNLALVHRFQIHPPDEPNGAVRVTYNSRSTSDGLIKKIKETGKMDYITFGTKYDPCMSLFQKVQSVFMGVKNDTRKMDELSVSVTMSVNFPGLSKTGSETSDTYKRGNIQTLCNKSDASVFQMLDPETLEPIGVASQKTLHPDLVGAASATHAKFDPETGDCYNYNLEFAKGKGTYRVFSVSASTAKTSILATITADPAYLHSLFITKNYVILCVWNSVYTRGGIRLLWDKNVADSIAPYDSSRPCKWYVVDRKPVEEGRQGHIATYDSDPFFCFHTINSYEEVRADGKIDIVADLVAYSNLDIIKQFYIDNIISDSKAAAVWAKKTENKGQLRRFTLPGIPTKRISKSAGKYVPPVSKAISGLVGDRDISPELPTRMFYISFKQA